ncbi:anti-phage protein KwaB [Aliivibrio sp. EL58]|uniref:anti-phage protein KwaB n=1 Tax=Aliivibrio sp. EL58 TaxID=2107582 RepID=UPI000EFB493E|nr:anti-phage protein KwaB [Aliivibrio sp. EL58]
MNKTKIKSDIKDVVTNCTGIKVFFLDKFNNVLDSDIDNTALQDYKTRYVNFLLKTYIENIAFDCIPLSQNDGRSHALYYYDFSDRIVELDAIDTAHTLPANRKIDIYPIKHKGLQDVHAVVVRLKSDKGESMSFYNLVRAVNLFKHESKFMVTFSNNRIIPVSEDVIRLNTDFIFARVKDYYLIKEPSKFERDFAFDKIIRAKAKDFISDLRAMSLVDCSVKFESKLDNDTSFARKFVKVFKGSAVVESNLTNQQLIDFAINHPVFKEKLKLNATGDKFDLNSLARCDNFLKLLDEEFLVSELTKQNYHAKVKDRV